MSSKNRRHSFTQQQAIFISDNYLNMTLYELTKLFNEKFGTRLIYSQIKNKVQRMKVTKRNLKKNHGKYTHEMVEFLVTNYNTVKLDDLTNMFNEKFNTDFTKSALWHKLDRCLNSKYDRTREYTPRVKWTKELENFLKVNYNDHTYKEVSEMLNEKFNIKTTPSSIEHKVSRLGLRKSKEAMQKSFKKKRLSRFHFKKGQAPATKKPIGYETVRNDGFIWIKVAEPNVFEQKHRYIYRYHYGKIPEGANIVFLNGNRHDFRIENLVAMSNAELAHFVGTRIETNNNDDIAKIKLAIAKVKETVFRKERRK